ncbi:MAG: glycosyltransferase, partial [Pseudomonadota bacterium]
AFYRTLKFMGKTPIPENVGDFRLIDRKALEALKLFPERSRFMKGVFALLGFEQAEVVFDRPARAVGAPKQRLRPLISLALEGLISFSIAPLRIWTVIGLFTALAAGVYGVVIVVRTLVFGIDTPGYASLITVVLFMNGLILLGLGMIGEYLSRVFTEVKQRPLYLVREADGVDADGPGRPVQIDQRSS